MKEEEIKIVAGKIDGKSILIKNKILWSNIE